MRPLLHYQTVWYHSLYTSHLSCRADTQVGPYKGIKRVWYHCRGAPVCAPVTHKRLVPTKASPQGEGFFHGPTQAADKRATLGAQGNSPPGLGTDEGRGELGFAQPKISRASATTQVPFRARRSQTGQSREFPGATRRRLFAYFFWKKYDPFLVGTSMEGYPSGGVQGKAKLRHTIPAKRPERGSASPRSGPRVKGEALG